MRLTMVGLLLVASLPVAAAESWIGVGDFAFSPSEARASTWETVVWRWAEGSEHGVVADTGEVWCETRASGTCRRTFSDAGAHGYHCPLHPAMVGRVTVGARGGDAGAPLLARFDVEVDGLRVVADATASAGSATAIESYAWTWGDGNASSGRVAEHVYAVPGVYTIALELVDETGRAVRSSREVRAPGETDARVRFQATAVGTRVFLDAASAQDVVRRAWDFGDAARVFCDGGRCEASSDATQVTSPTSLSHLYRRGGSFSVRHDAWLADGTNVSATLDVVAEAPDAFHVEVAGFRVFLDASFVRAYPNATYEWRFGDATRATGPLAEHEFPREGRWSIALLLRDDAGELTIEREVMLFAAPPPGPDPSAPPPVSPSRAVPAAAWPLALLGALALARPGSERYK